MATSAMQASCHEVSPGAKALRVALASEVPVGTHPNRGEDVAPGDRHTRPVVSVLCSAAASTPKFAMQTRLCLALTLPLALVACSEAEPQPDPQIPSYNPHPEPPAVLRDVAPIDDDAAFTRPYVPGHRTTMDGRVAVRVQGGPPGTSRLQQNLSFYLFAPEKLDAPILDGPTGAAILASEEPYDVPFPPAMEPGVVRLGHHAICDPTTPFPTPGERPNPYPCGDEGAQDCYDLTILSSVSMGANTRLWGTPVTVYIQDPKTPQAQIVEVTRGEPVGGTTIPATLEFMEPAITMDGRLLTGRLGRFPRTWTHPSTGEVLNRPYDLVYFQLPPEAEPCDVTGWATWHPMSHAPYDPNMQGVYGLAAYPFRDTEGTPIPDGEDLGGTYPWVDREGANVFMTGIHGTITEQSEERFPRRCVHEGCDTLRENVDWDRGFMIGGLWTRGRFALVDGLINNMDWAVGVSPTAHWMVDLYRTGTGEPVEVRFGTGRFIDALRTAGGPYPAGYTHNANILDSLQHLANHHEATRPVTPRDVVWLMSSGVVSDEVAFDDFMDADALIVSNMQASITQLFHDGASLSIPKHHNGEVRTLTRPDVPLLAEYPLTPDALEDIHLQNAASSLRWNVPPYGHIDAGTARIEPAALGGIEGKGLWLSGAAEVRYDLPAQPRSVTDAGAYLSIFVDSRVSDPLDRGLLAFPDGTAIHLRGGSSPAVSYLADGEVVHEVALPTAHGWRHLGWQLDPGFARVTLLVDGFPLDRFDAPSPLFVPREGTLTVAPEGAYGQRFRGWIDDLKLILRPLDPESACNHARGTLIAVDDHEAWSTVAARHPAWSHEALAALTGDAASDFVCYHDYSADLAAHLGNIPAGTRSLRDAVIFPEGPIRYGAPRPDSTSNAFCTSCHTADSPGGLSLDALTLRPDVHAEDDPRRQPHQPPRRVFGNIPAGWIPAGEGPGGPSAPMQAPPEGVVIDAWLLPPG